MNKLTFLSEFFKTLATGLGIAALYTFGLFFWFILLGWIF